MNKLVLFLFTFLSVFGLLAQDEIWYDICPIKNAQRVPTATIYALSGEKTELQSYIGDKPTIVVFYRGGWCPYVCVIYPRWEK